MNNLGKQQLESVVRNLRKSGKPIAANAVQAAIDRIEHLEAELVAVNQGDADLLGGDITRILKRIFGGTK